MNFCEMTGGEVEKRKIRSDCFKRRNFEDVDKQIDNREHREVKSNPGNLAFTLGSRLGAEQQILTGM